MFRISTRLLSLRTINFRSYASASERQAYLEPTAPQWPEVATLLLDRPQTKNAISRQLLKVNLPQCIIQLLKELRTFMNVSHK